MESQLAIIVKDSGLEKTKADIILNQFQDYFKIAAEWEERVKTIVVTDSSQTVNMQMARTGRLFLREKRIDVENTRKSMKAQAVRDGKAIDGIANVLKALIEPIEIYLKEQEDFVKIKQQREAEEKRIKEDRLAEEKRLQDIRLEEERQKEMARENERLRVEVVERQRIADEKEKKQVDFLAKAEAEQGRIRDERLTEQKKSAAKLQEVVEKAKRAARDVAAARKRQQQTIKEQNQKIGKLEKKIECPSCGLKFKLVGTS